MDEQRLEYDAAAKRLVYVAEPGEAVAAKGGAARDLAGIVRSGMWKKQPVAAGSVRFETDDAAGANADALAFLQLAAEGPGGVATSEAQFGVREDFGLGPK